MREPFNRRDFHKTALVGAAGTLASAAKGENVLGANDRVRIGCIGVGNRGAQVLNAFTSHADAQIVALSDVYEPYLRGEYDKIDPRFKSPGRPVPKKQPDFGGDVAQKDFRRLLDRKDIDAVIVATPDHWHAIQTIMACDAGKDVYVEKPLSIVIREGRRMVEAAPEQRIVQVGTQRRSSKLYAKLAEMIHDGAIGKVTSVRSCYVSNLFPDGIGREQDSEPPEGFDWDTWLGPRPSRPFRADIAPYKFRWWSLYSSQIANQGVHYLDAMRWLTGETAPASVSAHGGIYAVKDDQDIPDTAEVIFEHASGMLMVLSVYEANGQETVRDCELEIRGTIGTVFAGMSRFEIVPEHGGQFQNPKPRRDRFVLTAKEIGYSSLDRDHAREFLDCVKSRRRPNADVEEGHRSTTMALLANLALATKSRLDWDHQSERVTNVETANVHLDYEYRAPWKRV